MRNRIVVRFVPAGVLVGVFAFASVLAGCGATPPQAPLAQAKHLDSALSTISTACGLADQTRAFARPGSPVPAQIQRPAARAVVKLAAVDARDPAWIYQGRTVRRIVIDAVRTLRGCGLTATAQDLAAREPG